MIEVFKQMIKAMENTTRLDFGSDSYRQFNAAIQSGKQAIAELESQEPVCPECKAEVLYECVACSSNNYPPQRTEQEPVELPCCGYTDASAIKWNSFNGVVQCHNCGQTYTPPAHPPQRTEQNFCSRCGKRTKDSTHIHTCTPPQD